MAQDKHLRVSGTAIPQTEENKLIVPAYDGLVAVIVMDKKGSVLYVYHPLSGWYTELDNRTVVHPE